MMQSSIELSPSEVRQYYVTRLSRLPKKQGRNLRLACVLHGGKSDSLSIDQQTGLWNCFSKCGRGGDVVDFERELTKVGFSDAVRSVSEIIGRPLGNAQFTPEEKKRWAAEKRRIEVALPAARLWRRAAVEMGDEVLVVLKAGIFDPTADQTANIGEVAELEQRLSCWRRLDGGDLVKAHRDFSTRDRKLAVAMVAAARARDERDQVAVANILMEISDAA